MLGDRQSCPSGRSAQRGRTTSHGGDLGRCHECLAARVRLGSRSIACDTVLFAQRDDPIASALCRRAGAYRLRATIGIAALLSVLSLWPIPVERTRPSARVLAIWALSFVSVIGTMVALLAVVAARYTAVFFDL